MNEKKEKNVVVDEGGGIHDHDHDHLSSVKEPFKDTYPLKKHDHIRLTNLSLTNSATYCLVSLRELTCYFDGHSFSTTTAFMTLHSETMKNCLSRGRQHQEHKSFPRGVGGEMIRSSEKRTPGPTHLQGCRERTTNTR